MQSIMTNCCQLKFSPRLYVYLEIDLLETPIVQHLIIRVDVEIDCCTFIVTEYIRVDHVHYFVKRVYGNCLTD
jgi:hypothetical protein